MWILLWLSLVDSGAHWLKPDWTQPALSVSVKQLFALHIEKQLSNNCWQLCFWAHSPTFNQLLQLMCIHFHYCMNYLAASDLPLQFMLQIRLRILHENYKNTSFFFPWCYFLYFLEYKLGPKYLNIEISVLMRLKGENFEMKFWIFPGFNQKKKSTIFRIKNII